MTQEYIHARKSVIWNRYIARKILAKYNKLRADYRYLDRQRTILKNQGVSFVLLDKRITDTKVELDEHRTAIRLLGEIMCRALDLWQLHGATLKDLCNLCNKPYAKAVAEIKPYRLDESFSGLIFIHNLDYLHSSSSFIDEDVDAPLTHCIKEYHLHMMLTTPELKAGLNEAFEECFPDLAAKSFTMATNAEGETVYFDRNGNELDPDELFRDPTKG